jgi:ABC-type multidrug transport system ATPase subunit
MQQRSPPHEHTWECASPRRARRRLREGVSGFGGTVVLREVSFSVRAGRLTMLLGASGSGKSVILKRILGLLSPIPASSASTDSAPTP